MNFSSFHTISRISLKRCLIAACFAFSSISFAQDIEEVIVKADYRQVEESALGTSLSILSEELLDTYAVEHLDDVLNFIPNLNFASGTSRARYFQIRGIGERSQFGSPINPSVGFIIDNVDFTGIGSIGTLVDVAQVEVLRGPQGTRYGANALAGLIYIKSNEPTNKPSAKLKLSAGNFSHKTLSLVLNQALSESVNGRFVVEKHSSDGFYKNDFLNIKDSNGRDELSLRAKLKFDITNKWAVNLTLSKVDMDNGYDTFSLDNTRTTFSDQPGKDKQDSNSFSLDSKWHLNKFDLEIILAFADSDLEYSYDEDWTFTGFHPFGYTSLDSYKRDKSINSFEARFISNENSRIFNDSTDWVLGVYRQSSEEDLLRQYTFLATDYESQYDFLTTSIFFQLDTAISESWALSFGARAETRDTTFKDSEALDFDPNETLWGGKLSLSHSTRQGSMTYLSLSRGYKSGGFNTDGSLQANLREFDSEYLWEFEAGVKANWQDLRLRLAVFYDKRIDQQVKSSLLNTRTDGSTEFIDFLGNAAKGTNLGLEVESQWFISESFTLSANLGLLKAEFDRFTNEFGEDLSGRKQSQAPSYTYHAAIDWQDGPWLINLSLRGKDEFFFSDRHRLKSTKYNLVNANISYTYQKYRFNLWARNLNDKDYSVRGFGSFGNDPRKNYVTEPYLQFGEPRMIGLTFTFDTNN